MGFTVEQECPQCGAPLQFDETDHLIHCPYCDVNSFLFTPNYFRYVLPQKASGKDTIYVPYLRFKGAVYYCRGFNTGYRIVDITRIGLKLQNIPLSLGLRPQAMKMRFVTPEIKGTFLRFSLKASEILARAGKLSTGTTHQQILHRAFIGETMSLIYLPLYMDGDRLFDGVVNRLLANLTPEAQEGIESAVIKNPRWRIRFIPTLCPRCGWTLKGEMDSVVLSCANCHTLWEAREGRFVQVSHSLVPGKDSKTFYLPFWKMRADTKGLKINTFSDFIRLTNQPRPVNDETGEEEMNYWSPAFKIRPKLFLNLSRQFTISQPRFREEEELPDKNIHPVTLPLTEAVQALKIILASSTVSKKNVFPYLPRINFKTKHSTLVYLPFRETGHDMIQQDTGISVSKQGLGFGRKL
jgi:predicted RNA-binding Zn-ribbon protein involved in translation (DUF1610 family)